MVLDGCMKMRLVVIDNKQMIKHLTLLLFIGLAWGKTLLDKGICPYDSEKKESIIFY